MTKILQTFKVKVTPHTIDKIFEIADADDNGTIEFNEFVAAMRTILGDKEQQLRNTFKMFDLDNNGTIDKKELGSAFKALGDEISNTEVNMIFDEYDTDHNGQIDFNEFCAMVKSLGI